MPLYTFADAKALDKFYTKPAQARFTISVAKAYLSLLGQEFAGKRVLEPSAGAGAFLNVLGGDDHAGVIAFDIAPEDDRITRADFLTVPASVIGADRSSVITIGNPPFGKSGRLAVSFLNRALDLSDLVVMILPLTFRKWATQKQISASARLVGDVDIPEDSFTVNGKDYSVRCCVQVWTTLPLGGTGLINLRKTVAPAIRHPDFECWQYNATEEAKKYFDYDWDFGVLRQGYGDYSAFIRKGDRICDRKQWIFFKAKTPEVLARLQSIDFEDLSRTNTSMPGFGKTEIIARYEEMFGERQDTGARLSVRSALLIQEAISALIRNGDITGGGDDFDREACLALAGMTGFEIVDPDKFSRDYKEYKRICLDVLNDDTGLKSYDFSKYRSSGLVSRVSMKDFLIISQPNGSQNFPDVLIIADHVGIPIEFKSGKQDKIVWNSGLPRPDGVYVFHKYGGKNQATTCLMGDEMIDHEDYVLLTAARRQMERVAAACNERLTRNGSHFSLYPRPMHNSNMRYIGHPSRDERERRVMDHILRLAFPSVSSDKALEEVSDT